jgi:large repetitive protein
VNARHPSGGRRTLVARRRAPIVLLVLLASLVVLAGASAAGEAPANTSPPFVNGVAQEGQTLTLQGGSWSGTSPILLTYQWKLCHSDGSNCTSITGAQSQTFTVQADDVGGTVRALVTANNSGGTSTALSDPSAVVSGVNAPTPTSMPSISGTAQEGSSLGTANGSWSGSGTISFQYRWERCDTHGSACGPIAGATTSAYTLGSSDVGRTVRAEVTGTNSSGSTTVASTQSAVVAALGKAPANTSQPTLGGTFSQGSIVWINQGSWSGTSTIAYSYVWQRCDGNGNNCGSVTGPGGPKYTLTRDDVGHRMRGLVTASNSLGSATAATAVSGVVGSSRVPVNTGLPQITGTTSVGQRLTAAVGSWSGAAPLHYFFQWALSNSKGGYDPISGAVAQTFVPTSADVGHVLYVQIKAQNSYGAAFATSKPSGSISSVPTPPGVIPVGSVSLPNRLVVAKVSFSPSILRTRNAFSMRVIVKDSNGHPVQGAAVYALGLPYGWVKSGSKTQTGPTGVATLTVVPSIRLPIGHDHALVMFVRASKPGGSALAGVSTRRLVQVHIK